MDFVAENCLEDGGMRQRVELGLCRAYILRSPVALACAYLYTLHAIISHTLHFIRTHLQYGIRLRIRIFVKFLTNMNTITKGS